MYPASSVTLPRAGSGQWISRVDTTASLCVHISGELDAVCARVLCCSPGGASSAGVPSGKKLLWLFKEDDECPGT